MVGSGMGMKGIVRLGAATGAALVALAAGTTAAAFAEPPSLTISSPVTGTVTNERSPAFSGTTSDTLDTVTLDVYQGADTKGTRVREEIVAPVGNAWGVAPAALPDGTYTAIAQQTDSGTLEVGSSPEVTFTVDGTAPSVTLNAVPAVVNKGSLDFGGSAGTAPGDAETVRYVVYSGSVAGGTEVASGAVPGQSGNWSSGSVALADGVYTVEAFQRDQAGNEGASAAATFRVDTTPPSGLSLNPVAAVTSNATPTLGGGAGTQEGDGPVRVLLDGKLVSEAQVVGGQWSYTASHLSDGNHTVRAEQVDEAGNVSKTSAASFRVDTKAPELTVSSPKSGDTLKSSLVTFSGETSNAEGDESSVTIEVVKDEAGEVTQKFSVTRSGSKWNSQSTGLRLSNGTYTVHAEQLDSAGNKGVSPSVTFTVASPAPTVTLKPLPRYTNAQAPQFGGVADGSEEAERKLTLKVWKGDSASGTLAESVAINLPAGEAWAIQLPEPLAEGTYTAQAEQPAVAKNPAGVSDTTTFVVDTTAPVPTLAGAERSTGLETVSGVAGIAPGDRRQVTAELFQGSSVEEGAAFETITVNADQLSGAWNATFANLPGGQYTVLARQSDEAGNTGHSPPQPFTVDVPPPEAPAAPPAPSPPAAAFTWVPGNPTVGQTVSFVSKSTAGSTPIASLAWDFAGSGPFAAGPAIATTTFATAGAHTVRLQVTDADGLSSTASETVTVGAQVLRLMQPFPIVRIAGSETASGVKVKLLTVQAPPAAKVAVSCKGKGCKTKTESRVATASSKSKRAAGGILLAFPRFERALKAGAVLQIRVSRSGEIGKFTSFTIRRKKLPVRVDACLRPPSSSPSPCPSQ
ncbi:MAG TPA: Ig-like domain-containing protein [Solirubrobacteraceae bacterium]|nr:Ig-like domain-containing protein [Solirubrobacteraceae bacterium]